MGVNDFGSVSRVRSEAPNNSCRCAVVVLSRAGVARVHVISLESPGKILERKFVVESAANIDEERIVDKSAGIQVPHADHGIDEGTEFADVGGDPWAADEVVLSNAGAAVKAAGVNDQAYMGKAWEGNGFKRAIPSAIALPLDYVGELSIGNTSVNVSIGQEPVELCRHRDGEQEHAQKRQHSGSSFRQEIFLPGGRAGQKVQISQRNPLDAVYRMAKMYRGTKNVRARTCTAECRCDENLTDIHGAKTMRLSSMY